MNKHLFQTALLAIGLVLLTGCGVEATSTIEDPTTATSVNQPVSLAGHPEAPAGWTLAHPVRRHGRLANYRGKVISELDPIELTRPKSM